MMTETTKQTRRDAVLYRRATVGLAAIGVCWLVGQAWGAYQAVLTLVPMWCRAAACVLANAAVLAHWAGKAVR